MISQETGGPAFPIIGMQNRNGQQIEFVHAAGMDLRDYFAAKAMVGLLQGVAASGDKVTDAEMLANFSYEVADSMLKERMK